MTFESIRSRRPDIAHTTVNPRFLDLRNYNRSWDERARFAAQFIGQKWVADIGCGRQGLSRYLRPGTVYLPSDVKAWDRSVEVCDLNAGKYPLTSLSLCETASLLGVVERIHNLPGLFELLAQHTEFVVVSYHDINTPTTRKDDWLHAYSESEFNGLLAAAGFMVDATITYRKTLKIWYATNTGFTDDFRSRRRDRQSSYSPSSVPLKTRLSRLRHHAGRRAYLSERPVRASMRRR